MAFFKPVSIYNFYAFWNAKCLSKCIKLYIYPGADPGSNLQKGFDLLILHDYLLIFPDSSENSPWKWNNFVSKGGLSEPPEPTLDPPLVIKRKSN